MRKRTLERFALGIALLGATMYLRSGYAADATLTIYVLDGNQPTLEASSGPLQGMPTADPKATTFKVPLENRLVFPLLLRVTAAEPGADIFPLRIETPITWSNKTNVVRLKSSKASGTSNEVRALYARTIAEVQQLPALYSEARRIADARIAALQGNWHQLHDYDVQAVYKLLEIIHAMNSRYIIPADDISDYRSWLYDAVEQSPRRVASAVGLNNAREMLVHIDALQGKRFIPLWSFVKDPGKPCVIRGPLLRDFHEQFRALASAEERQAVERTMKLTEGHMLSAIAQCDSVRARCAPQSEVPQIIGSLNLLIEEIDNVHGATEIPEVRQMLESDQASLTGLRASLANGETRICGDPRLWSN